MCRPCLFSFIALCWSASGADLGYKVAPEWPELPAGWNFGEVAGVAANTGGRGNVLSGALESSTVDIAHEFTNLIVYQRAYQANSRVISTTDQIVQDLISLIH